MTSALLYMKQSVSLFILLTLSLTACSAADSIGINFILPDGTGKLTPKEKAGVEKVQQDNWNSISVSNDDPNGHNNTGELTELVDSKGEKVKKMRVDVGASASTQVFPSKGTSWGFIESDQTLLSTIASPQPSITVSNIPYRKYDVYVYAGQGDKGGHAKGNIIGKGGTFGKDPVNETKFLNFNWTDGTFVEGGAKDFEESKASVASNYFHFKDLRGKDFTFNFDGRLEGGGWAGVAAIQIVEIKN